MGFYHFYFPKKFVQSLLSTLNVTPYQNCCPLDPISSCFLVYSLCLVRYTLYSFLRKGTKNAKFKKSDVHENVFAPPSCLIDGYRIWMAEHSVGNNLPSAL